MKNFTFSIPVQIQFGAGISKQVGTLAGGLAASKNSRFGRRVLVIIDPAINGLPRIKDIITSMDEAGLKIRFFDEVESNPKDKDVYAAADQLLASQAGMVIGIGGGSTIDTAKAAALIAKHGGRVRDYAGWGKVPGPLIPIVAIPTTAGSGSEATSWSVITDTTSHEKLAIGDPHLTPTLALVDPLLTISLPAGATAATGMDALSHSIEAYICALSNPVNDLLALEAIHLVSVNLQRVVADAADLDGRQAMMLASTLGGIVINNADVAGVHCLSEGMGSIYNAPHGLLNAILLPYFMHFWLNSSHDRFVRIAQAFGASPDPEEAVFQVMALFQALNLPGLSEIGVNQADFPKLASLAESNVSNSSNPIPMNSSDYLRILERSMAGQILLPK
jgi:alcohol dehydrogenase